MHIGLIGGIGVAATVAYYQRLTAAAQAAGHRIEVTIAHADVQTLIRNNLADDRATQARHFASHIDQLKGAGAQIVALTSLGAHYCYDETLALSSLPMISAVEPLDAYFAAQGLERVGILGTRVVMRTGLYGQLRQTTPVVLEAEIDVLGQSYQDLAVAGHCTEDTRTQMINAGARLMAQGAQAVILAGTDLNLAFDGRDVGYPVIDALDVHVAELVKIATQ
jgi:aspartate racemase